MEVRNVLIIFDGMSKLHGTGFSTEHIIDAVFLETATATAITID